MPTQAGTRTYWVPSAAYPHRGWSPQTGCAGCLSAVLGLTRRVCSVQGLEHTCRLCWGWGIHAGCIWCLFAQGLEHTGNTQGCAMVSFPLCARMSQRRRRRAEGSQRDRPQQNAWVTDSTEGKQQSMARRLARALARTMHCAHLNVSFAAAAPFCVEFLFFLACHWHHGEAGWQGAAHWHDAQGGFCKCQGRH